jgi:hypothetical protein
MIRIRCPKCSERLALDDADAGRVGECPECTSRFRIPVPRQQAVVEAPDRRDDFDEDEERPRRRDDFDEEERPRRRKRRRRSKQGSFSLCDNLPGSYVTQSNLGILIGLVLNVPAAIMLRDPRTSAVAALLMVLALPFWLWGCAAYAKNKGQSEMFGFLGFFGLLGLIVLVALPNRSS